MPIYAYKCESCGQSKDVLQKMSDAPLTVCPFCGAEAFKKQLTAAGFQLKGSGWYVTDFRNGGTSAPAPATTAADAAKPAASSDTPAKSADAPAPAPAPAAKNDTAAAPAKAAAPRAAD
ncbi:FmdB family transcriptional regulator [Rhodoferax koreense]|uniref:FmdB family transcriptional regulator n=1 Tax=Rhodoferax koreensis TaxID=1842727 RepID=A0A1P8K0A0_9BURK|nr:FmdB family zinc ribbon protein [Rhodoferax koreense]APW39433.1 FmdB family transcriptional regulator [Rhodoferax koreense]